MNLSLVASPSLKLNFSQGLWRFELETTAVQRGTAYDVNLSSTLEQELHNQFMRRTLKDRFARPVDLITNELLLITLIS